METVKLFPRLRSFWFGLTLPVRALRLALSHPKLLIWSALPLAITAAVYYFVIRGLQGWVNHGVQGSLASWGWTTEGWIAQLLAVVSWVLVLVVAAFTFSFVAGIVASPFNDFLAEAAEPHVPGLVPVGSPTLPQRLRAIGLDVGKALAAGLLSFLALLLSWVPLLNVLSFLIAVTLLTFQFVSYPQTRRGQGLRAGFRFLQDHLCASLGFGLALTALFAIPLVSVLALPLAVVGGTLLAGRAGQRSPADAPFRLR
jgi:CysZ protein